MWSGCAAVFVAFTQTRGAHCRPLDPWLASSPVLVHAMATAALVGAAASGVLPDGPLSSLPEDPEQAAAKKSTPKDSRSVFQPMLLFLRNRSRARLCP